MRNKLKLGLLVTYLLTAAGASASRPLGPSVLELDMNDRRCTIQAAGAAETRLEAAYLIPLLQRQSGNLARWDAFMKSRKWKAGVPMGEQMNSKEASIFERLQQETKVGLLAWMVEELRVRDLRVFIAGASVAKKIDIYGQIPKDESSDEFVVATILAGGRDILALEPEGEARILAETGKCTLERALIVEARRAKGVVGNQIETVNSVSTVHYRADLLLLARLEHVSKLRRDVRRQSQLEAPGDADHFNVVWEEWRRDDRIIDSDHKLTGILDYIGEKIPTEFAKEVGKPPRLKH